MKKRRFQNGYGPETRLPFPFLPQSVWPEFTVKYMFTARLSCGSAARKEANASSADPVSQDPFFLPERRHESQNPFASVP